MTTEDILALMDMEDAEAAKRAGGPNAGGDLIGAGATPGQKAAPVSPTALKLDKWSLRRGKELLADDEQLREAAGLKGGEPDSEAAYWEKAVADFHAAAYEPAPELADKCEDELRSDFTRQLMETPEFHEMRAQTVLNQAAAEIATACFSKQFQVRRAEAARDQAQKGAKGKGRGGKGLGFAGEPDAELQTMKAAAKAVAEACKSVQDMTDAAEALGMGGGGPEAGKMDPKRIAALYGRVKASPRLAQIAKLAGRFRRLAQSKQRQKVTHGADEVVGVTLGDEVAKLVPAELSKLADPTLALDTMRRLMERQTLCRETRASEPVGKGPIVVVVDESGSMSGPKVETAKALALALAWIARKQKRWCCLISFSGGCKIEPGSQVILPPGKPNEAELLSWLEHFYGGGTTMDVPLAEVPAWWPEYVKRGMARGKTDMIVITDAELHVPDELVKTFNAFKAAEKVKMTTLVVQGRPGNIECVSDEVFCLPAITTENEAIGKVLSV